MTDQVGTAVLTLTTDNRGLDSGVEAAEKKAQSLEAKFGAVGKALAGAFSIQQVLEFGRVTVGAFGESEAATNTLTQALKANGTATPQLIKGYVDLASQFQRTTAFSDDLIVEMESLLTQVGHVAPGQMKQALKAATDLSAGLGIDLRSATMAVAKSFDGGTTAMTKMLPSLKGIIKEGASTEEILAAINERFGGQAAAQLDTYNGRLEQFKNKINDSQETIGGMLTKGLNPMMKAFGDLPEPMQLVIGGITTLSPNLETLTMGLLAVGGPGKALALAKSAAGGLQTALATLWPIVAVGATAFAAWKIGSWIGEASGLTDGIERMTGRLMGLTPEQINASMAARKHAEAMKAQAQATTEASNALPPVVQVSKEAAAASALAKLNTDLHAAATVKLSGDTLAYVTNALKAGKSTSEIAKALTEAKLVSVDASVAIDHVKQSLDAQAAATKKSKEEQDKWTKGVSDANFEFKKWGTQILATTPTLGGLSKTFVEFGGVSDGVINNLGLDISHGLVGAVDLFGNAVDVDLLPHLDLVKGKTFDIGKEEETTRTTTDDLAKAFTQMALIGDGALSTLTRGIGTMIASFGVAKESMGSLKSGFGSLGKGDTLAGITSIASGIGGIISLASTAISAVKSLWNWAKGGEEGRVVNPARDQWFGGHGGTVDSVAEDLAGAGIFGEDARVLIQHVFDAKTKSSFDQAASAIDSAIKGGLPGFATGTMGRFLNFGDGTPVMLHGREKVVTEGEEGRAPITLTDIHQALGSLNDNINRRLPHMFGIALADALT